MTKARDLRFRPDIEGLRGIAILIVVAYHVALPGFTGGYVGVDVFFVLSGYLITGLLVREIEGTGRLALIEFYARRTRRLLPGLALVLVATTGIGYVVYSPLKQHELAVSEVATAAYLGNIYFAWQGNSYLGADAETNPLLHTWSLSVEEQFYLAWPLLIWLLLSLGRKVKASSSAGRKRLIRVISICSIASFVLSVKLTHTRQPWAFYSSPPRAWEFAVGALGVLLPIPNRPRLTRSLGWIGLGLLGYSVLSFSRLTLFPGLAALVPVLGAVTLLCTGARCTECGVNGLISAKWLQGLGRLSYSWYLWHWPILTLMGAWMGHLHLLARLGCLLLSLGLAALSYRLVESPVRHSRLLAGSPLYSIGVAAGLTILSVGAALTWYQASRYALSTPAQLRVLMARNDVPNLPKKCIASFEETSVNKCLFGNKNASNTILLFGDSHAAQWFPAINAIVTSEGWRLVTLMKSACAPADVSFVYPTLGRRYVECEQWRESALREIKQISPRLVIVTGSQWYAMASTGPAAVSSTDYLIGMKRTFRALSASGAHVIYLWDNPRSVFNITDCLSLVDWQLGWRRRSPCVFSREASVDETVHRLELQASVGLDVTPVDLTNYICPGSTCKPEIANTIVYRDSNHMTVSFVMTLAPVLRGILEKALKEQKFWEGPRAGK